MSLIIHSIPILEDNYVWLIQSSHSRHVIVLDPGDAAPILTYISDQKLIPVALLITHRDYDHIDGIAAFLEQYEVPVYGPKNDEIPYINHKLSAQDNLIIDDHFPSFHIIDVPGHTPGHIAYVIENRLFCADALFAGGCGRVRQNAYATAYHSLLSLAALPESTQMYCSHEYTVANLQFALTVEPHNQATQTRLAYAQKLRKKGQMTLPSTIGEELATNPFLRCHEPGLKQAVEQHIGQTLDDDLAVFTALRQWKDSF